MALGGAEEVEGSQYREVIRQVLREAKAEAEKHG